ncbi:MAG TPA: glycine cleavage system protein GcvH [Methylophilaceae bacterium]|nr:glycine cleavage system protein GcvH [Methylophilaceae bacterium]HQR60265.1 glycine cleavage system protein GcvH [Methylophilaceae bacterium]
MSIPATLKYTPSHEWVRLEADGSITVGITDHAQALLGDMVFIELPTVGKSAAAEEQVAVVESVKAASDIYAPVAGVVTEANQNLADAPERVNEDAYAAWLFKMQPASVADVDGLLDAAGYASEIGA